MRRLIIVTLALGWVGVPDSALAEEVWSLDLTGVDLVSDAPDGAKIAVGDHFSITLGSGVGVWSEAEDRVLITFDVDQLGFDPPLDVRTLSRDGVTTKRGWIVTTPEFQGSFRRGTLRREGRVLHFEGAAESGMAGGWVTAGVIGVLTLFLLRRSSTMRARLNEPRTPLRRRST